MREECDDGVGEIEEMGPKVLRKAIGRIGFELMRSEVDFTHLLREHGVDLQCSFP